MMFPKLKAAIIEDNQLSAFALRQCLNIVNPEIEVCGEAADTRQAINLIEAHQPDIIFLDIQLKDGLSFQVVDAIRQAGGHIGELIFITGTGRSDYALKALEYDCLDFMIKPFTDHSVHLAIKKVKERLIQKRLLAYLQERKTQQMSKVVIRVEKNSKIAIEIARISYFEAKGQCTIVHLSDGTCVTTAQILGRFKKLLADNIDFFEIRNSLVVNVGHVKSFNHKSLETTMVNGDVIEASRRSGAKFNEFWNEFSQHHFTFQS